MHARKNERGELSIVVTNYHDGEYPFTADSAHVLHVWDGLTLSFLEFLDHEQTGNNLQVSEDNEKVFRGFLAEQLHHYQVEPMQEADLVGQVIYVVSGSPVSVFKAFADYAVMLTDDVRAGGPGADDGTYDYFPGAVEALRQLAEGFIEVEDKDYADAARTVYNEVVDIAHSTHYKGNEEADDLLPRL